MMDFSLGFKEKIQMNIVHTATQHIERQNNRKGKKNSQLNIVYNNNILQSHKTIQIFPLVIGILYFSSNSSILISQFFVYFLLFWNCSFYFLFLFTLPKFGFLFVCDFIIGTYFIWYYQQLTCSWACAYKQLLNDIFFFLHSNWMRRKQKLHCQSMVKIRGKKP